MNLRIRAKREKQVFGILEQLAKYVQPNLGLSSYVPDLIKEYSKLNHFKIYMHEEMIVIVKGKRYYIWIEEGKIYNIKHYHRKVRKESLECYGYNYRGRRR